MGSTNKPVTSDREDFPVGSMLLTRTTVVGYVVDITTGAYAKTKSGVAWIEFIDFDKEVLLLGLKTNYMSLSSCMLIYNPETQHTLYLDNVDAVYSFKKIIC